MDIRRIFKKKKIQILVPVLGFVIVALIVLILIIPSTKKEGVIADDVKEEIETATEINILETDAVCELNNDADINSFFESYYKALADGDAGIVTASFDSADYLPDILSLSTLVEEYDNIRVYTAPGFEDGETAAFVYSDVKFNNIDTNAPSVDSFYIIENEDGIKIKTEMYENPDIAAYLNKLADKEPIKGIMDNTEKWMETSLEKDDMLKDIYNAMQSGITSSEGN